MNRIIITFSEGLCFTHPKRATVGTQMTGAEKDTLIALVEQGPLWDGDVPSKTGRDALLAHGLAVRVVVKGEDGWQAATYAGRDAYKELFMAGDRPYRGTMRPADEGRLDPGVGRPVPLKSSTLLAAEARIEELREAVRSARADEAHCWASRVDALTAQLREVEARYMALLKAVVDGVAMQPKTVVMDLGPNPAATGAR